LLHCKRSKLIPKHLNNYNALGFTFYCDSSTLRAVKHCNNFISKMLNLEISDNFKQCKSLITSIYWLSRIIENNLPIYLVQKFYNTQQRSLRSLYLNENNKFTEKLFWLQRNAEFSSFQRNLLTNNKVKKLKYFCSNAMVNSINDIKLSLDNPHHTPNAHTFTIELDPVNYKFEPKLLLEPREKWFVNISNAFIPDNVIGLLQLGEGFALPPTDSKKLITEYIKHIENNLSKLQYHKFTSRFRSQMCSFVTQMNNIQKHRTDIDKIILESLSVTRTFLKNNPNVIFTRADKGNTVVALDRDVYKNKMELLLSDTNTYSILKRNPVNGLLKDLKELLKRWLNLKYISSSIHCLLNSSNAFLPRAYGLPKIHKPGFPLRIIISSTDSPLHNLAEYLQNILSNSLPIPPSHIQNSIDLAQKLVGFRFPEESSLVSLDVISLFTNVPIDMVLDILDENWIHIQSHTSIPKSEFILAAKFVLNSTFFQFNQLYYKQTFGAPMGSPLSPVVADLVMQRLERTVISSLNIRPTFYYRC